ncbi:MAG: hypothetical protein WA364_25070 [Candidatus Nitrosopolaris sp.]
MAASNDNILIFDGSIIIGHLGAKLLDTPLGREITLPLLQIPSSTFGIQPGLRFIISGKDSLHCLLYHKNH